MTKKLRRPRASWLAVLDALSDGQEWYGAQVQKAAPEVLGRDKVYVVLLALVQRNLIVARYETKAEQRYRGPERRLYRITEAGRRWRSAMRAERQ